MVHPGGAAHSFSSPLGIASESFFIHLSSSLRSMGGLRGIRRLEPAAAGCCDCASRTSCWNSLNVCSSSNKGRSCLVAGCSQYGRSSICDASISSSDQSRNKVGGPRLGVPPLPAQASEGSVTERVPVFCLARFVPVTDDQPSRVWTAKLRTSAYSGGNGPLREAQARVPRRARAHQEKWKQSGLFLFDSLFALCTSSSAHSFFCSSNPTVLNQRETTTPKKIHQMPATQSVPAIASSVSSLPGKQDRCAGLLPRCAVSLCSTSTPFAASCAAPVALCTEIVAAAHVDSTSKPERALEGGLVG